MLSNRNFALVDLFFCILIVACVFFPSLLSSTLDLKTLGILGAVAFVLLVGARGAGAGLILIVAARLEAAAKNSSPQKAAILNYSKNILLTFLISYTEGFFWGLALFLPIYALFWFVGNPLEPTGKQMLSQMAASAFQPLESARIIRFPDETARLAFFALAMFFTAASYFALFAMKNWGFSIFEVFLKEKLQLLEKSHGNRTWTKEILELYRNWLKAVRNEE